MTCYGDEGSRAPSPYRLDARTVSSPYIRHIGLIVPGRSLSELLDDLKMKPENVIFDDSNESTIIKLGFLSEIDNMVAAAVIT